MAAGGKPQPGLGVADLGREFEGVVLPLGGQIGEGALGEFPAFGAGQRYRDGAGKAVSRARCGAEDIGSTRHDIHAPVTGVLEREGTLHLDAQATPIEGIQRPALVDGGRAGAAGKVGERPVLRLVCVFFSSAFLVSAFLPSSFFAPDLESSVVLASDFFSGDFFSAVCFSFSFYPTRQWVVQNDEILARVLTFAALFGSGLPLLGSFFDPAFSS